MLDTKPVKGLIKALASVITSDMIQEIGSNAELIVYLAFDRAMKACGIGASVRKRVLGEDHYKQVQEYLNLLDNKDLPAQPEPKPTDNGSTPDTSVGNTDSPVLSSIPEQAGS